MTDAIEVVRYDDTRAAEWNAFVGASNNGTMFHRQDFLAYHPDDRYAFHHLLFYKKGHLIAVLPGAVTQEMFKSPAGASFGGFVTRKDLGIRDADMLVKALVRYCASLRIKEAYLTPPMQIYCATFSETVEYALHYNHFILISSLYSSVIDFSRIRAAADLSRNTRHKINKARNKGVTVVESDDYAAFYPILLKNKAKFGVAPTHSLDELLRIERLMPGMMTLFLALHESRPVAGELLFRANPRCALNFYTMHDYDYRHLFAVNYLIDHSTRWCIEHGFDYLDYGVSADTISADPMEPSWTLAVFKESMGATGCLRKTYYRRIF